MLTSYNLIDDEKAMLGACYFSGVGVRRDVEEAVSYWKMAAGNGEPLAQTNLGYCYEAGVGVERSPVRLLLLTSTFPSPSVSPNKKTCLLVLSLLPPPPAAISAAYFTSLSWIEPIAFKNSILSFLFN